MMSKIHRQGRQVGFKADHNIFHEEPSASTPQVCWPGCTANLEASFGGQLQLAIVDSRVLEPDCCAGCLWV